MIECGSSIVDLIKEIELSAQNLLTILHAIVNMTGGTYMIIKELKIFTLTMIRIFIQAPKIMRKVTTGMI